MFNINKNEVAAEHLNIFMYRVILYSLISLIFCFGLERLELSMSAGLYLIPFVINLMVFEHLQKRYGVKSYSLFNLSILFFLLSYFVIFSWVFLQIVGAELEPTRIMNLLFGHSIYLFFAAFLSSTYEKIRVKRRNKKKKSK
jgi:hypothetical protein